jgi:exodeoxyribonuclease-3
MSLTVGTWNINSVRLRTGLVERVLSEHAPDVLCLQETKCPDQHFPAEPFRALGYTHQAISGQKGYHGVAILSRVPLKDVTCRPFCDKGDARHVAATLPNGIELHNFYIPAGGDVPDRTLNPKFAHKLDFLTELTEWTAGWAADGRPRLLVGDLNIAPLEEDVWSHKQLLNVVSHTPIEVAHLTRVQEVGQWTDVMRHFVPPPERLYTWWSYRSPDWAAADKGRRLDHVWASPGLAPALRAGRVVKDARGWERPSDHVPVLVTLDA